MEVSPRVHKRKDSHSIQQIYKKNRIHSKSVDLFLIKILSDEYMRDQPAGPASNKASQPALGLD